jgi:hypothetical protein
MNTTATSYRTAISFSSDGSLEYITQEPLGFEAGDNNLRRYVGNGVLNKIDPEGLTEQTFEAPQKPPLKQPDYRIPPSIRFPYQRKPTRYEIIIEEPNEILPSPRSWGPIVGIIPGIPANREVILYYDPLYHRYCPLRYPQGNPYSRLGRIPNMFGD